MTREELKTIREAYYWIAEYASLNGMSKEKSEMLFNLSHKLESMLSDLA